MAQDRGGWLTLARILRPRGNRGEVLAICDTSGPERFLELGRVFVFRDGDPSGEPREMEVEDAWDHQGKLVLKFRGVDSIGEADQWRKAEVRIPEAERAPAPEGEYYHSDLVGCAVVERGSDRVIGVVVSCQEYGGPLLLEVETADAARRILIPFAGAIVKEIDIGARRIVAELPEGLETL